MATWPASLPQYILRDGYGETQQEGTIRSNMDQGAAKSRPRYSSVVENVTGALSLNADQVTTLKNFHKVDCALGAVRFSWVHPRTQAVTTFRFVKAPSIAADGANFRASLELEIIP